MKINDAIASFLIDKTVAGASPNTIRNYTLNLQRFADRVPEDIELASITADHIRTFLEYLMTAQFVPQGVARRPAQRLGAKTIKNVHTCLSSLWTWAVKEGYANEHVVRAVDAPDPELAVIEPFTLDEVQRLLHALSHSLPWVTSRETQTERPERRQLRDRAIILFLLDTGVRVSELCNLTLDKIDIIQGRARVRSKGRMDTGQGKERIVKFSPTTAIALRRYLADRNVVNVPTKERVFTTRENLPFERRYMAKHLTRLGERANVKDVHAHRFRHTFAINYLRNGGDIYTLQDLLGHTSLEMCRRYLRLAQVDIETAHRRASPVENWRL